MSLRHLNTRDCNGTRLVVTNLSKKLWIVPIMSSLVPIIDWTLQDPVISFVIHRNQFLVKLALSSTIRKRGARLWTKLAKPVFSHEQLFVELRVRRSTDIKVKVKSDAQHGWFLEQSNKIHIKNVFKRVLWITLSWKQCVSISMGISWLCP